MYQLTNHVGTALYEFKAILCALVKAFEFLPSLNAKNEMALYPSALNVHQPFIRGTRNTEGKITVPVRLRCIQEDM